MEVIIRSDKDKAIELAARVIAKALREKLTLALGLATGNTMEPLYAKLAEMHTGGLFETIASTAKAISEIKNQISQSSRNRQISLWL